MKSYTDIEQSKKLAEILPIESADYHYIAQGEESYIYPYSLSSDAIEQYKNIKYIPCWSLAALLNYLREIGFFPNIEVDEHDVKMNISYYDEEEGKLLNSVHDIRVKAGTFVDACYEIIIELKEKGLL
jgi:hypothetical protein